MSENSKKNSSLTHVQFYRLCEWVSTNAERLMHERPTRPEAALQATRELGFPVSDHAIPGAQEATGVSWRALMNQAPNEAKQTYRELRAEQEVVRAQIAELTASVNVLRGLAHKLYFELGVQPPPGYPLPPRPGATGNERLVNLKPSN